MMINNSVFLITRYSYSKYNILYDIIIGIYNHIITKISLHQLLYNTTQILTLSNIRVILTFTQEMRKKI